MDDIIRRLRRVDEDNVTEEDYEEIGLRVSEYHQDVFQQASDEEAMELMDRTDRVEDALLAAAYDGESISISECIRVLRGHREPGEANLPEPSLEAFEDSLEDMDEEFEEAVNELFRIIDGR